MCQITTNFNITIFITNFMLNYNFFRKSVYFGETAKTCSGAAQCKTSQWCHSDPKVNFCNFDCVWVKDKKLMLYFKQVVFWTSNRWWIRNLKEFQEFFFLGFKAHFWAKSYYTLGCHRTGFCRFFKIDWFSEEFMV